MTPTSLTFIVPGPVLPWKRAVSGKNGHRFTPKAQREYQEHIKTCAWAELAKKGLVGRWPTQGRYALDVEARFPDYKVRDIDNVLKTLKDAVKGVVYMDDSRVDDERIKRVVGAGVGLIVRVEVLVERWSSQAGAR